MKYKMIPSPNCFKCKLAMDINRNESNNDVIYFDKHYFHKKCFGNMQEIKKKCIFCKKDIDITGSIDNETVLYEKHFYHKQCFIDWCNDTKRPSPKRMVALDNTDKYIECANIEIQMLKESRHYQTDIELRQNTDKQILDWFYGSDLCEFIRDQYDIQNVPWQMIKEVIQGSGRKNDFPIPIEHLYDMWTKKIDMLKRTYARNQASGKTMNTNQRISYDLSVLVNKYDSYKKWLEKQRILEVEEQINKMNNIVTSNIVSYSNQEQQSNDSDDISNLVDDIFGDD